MQLIHAHLPRGEDDVKIDLFFKDLTEKTSALTDAQVQFLRTKGNSIPDFDASGKMVRERLPFEHLVVIIYEPGLAAETTEILRTVIQATWPERDDIHLFEMDSGKPKLWSMRGGKK